MLKEWQFNILFFVGVGGAILLVIGPEFGLDIGNNPTAVTGLGSILAYVLTQRSALTRKRGRELRRREEENQEEEEPDDHE